MIATLWWLLLQWKHLKLLSYEWTIDEHRRRQRRRQWRWQQHWFSCKFDIQIGAFDAHFDCTATSINSENMCGHLLRMLLLFQFSCLPVDNWKIHWSDSWHRKMNGHKTRNTKPNWLCLAITNCLYGIKRSETNQGIQKKKKNEKQKKTTNDSNNKLLAFYRHSYTRTNRTNRHKGDKNTKFNVNNRPIQIINTTNYDAKHSHNEQKMYGKTK